MLMLIIVSCFLVFQTSTGQNLTTLAGRCNAQTAYFYGYCRVNTCLATETTILGQSFCDLYTAALRRPYVRCTNILPCCVRGGACRPTCLPGEVQLNQQRECAAGRRGLCCVNPTGSSVAPGSTALPRYAVVQRQEECSTRTAVRNRNASGTVTLPTSWPWMARLFYLGDAPGVCAGVLVSNDTVLTVAHCVIRTPSTQLQVRVGDFDLTRPERDEETVGVRNIEINRNFVPGTRGNDIALLKLARPITFTENKLPVCITDPLVPLAQPQVCFVSGWGATATGQVNAQLRVSPVTIMDTALCRAMIASASLNATTLGNDMICTEPLDRSPDGCLFDDGDMLSCLDANNRYTLVGLVAEYSCGSLPTIYTRVANHREAILSRL